MRLPADQPVALIDGRIRHAQAGDWLIANGRTPIEIVTPGQLVERYVVTEAATRTLPAAVCLRLEDTLGVGATRSPEDLVRAVERLAHLQIGDIRIDFTPGQLEEIRYRASKRGQTVEQAMRAVVDRIRDEIFWRS